MGQKRIGIIMHGVTGRMGMNQHLMRCVKEFQTAVISTGRCNTCCTA